MANAPITVTSLIIQAQKLSGDLNELLLKSSTLLTESQDVEQKVIECCAVHDDQLLKNMVKHCENDERVHQLLENAELQQTVEEYKSGVEHIMEKYNYHCNSKVLYDRHNLRETYVAKLQEVANTLEKRIEEMTLVMLFTMSLDEEDSQKNQRTIQQLVQENEEMRRQLQISNKCGGEDCFQQALPVGTECGTQIELDDTVTDDCDAISDDSVDSIRETSSSKANLTMTETDAEQLIDNKL